MPHRLAWIACALATTVLPGTTRTLNAHPADHHIADSVARALEQLPSYGVFDLLTFSIDHGTVTLEGYAYQAGLVSEAVVALERVAGVSHVANKVQPLPFPHKTIGFVTQCSNTFTRMTSVRATRSAAAT